MSETHVAVLMTAQKKSQKTRWEDHFTLQLKSHGFVVLDESAQRFDQLNLSNRMAVYRQFRFHPERRWTLDFAIPAIKLGIEIEGGIWRPGGGAHSRPTNIQRDVEKGNALVMLDWRLLRFSPVEIRAGTSIEMTAVLAMR